MITFASGGHPPSLLVNGVEDELVSPREATQMAAALRQSGNEVETALLEGVDHIRPIAAFSWPLRRLAPTLSLVTDYMHKQAGKKARCGR